MIKIDDRVILAGHGKSFFVSAGEGKLGTDFGLIDLSQLIGRSSGDVIRTHSGKEFIIRTPRATDIFDHARRSGAPMLPRDIGLVVGLTGMCRDDIVLDAGTGSGIAAIYFGGIAAKVHTYEKREDFAELARSNISESGLSSIEVICGDMLDAEGRYDIVHLDLGVTGEHVHHAYEILNFGGYLACYTPFFEQMALVNDSAKKLFSEVNSYECIMRDMDRSDRGTRPSTKVGHSGYLTIARK